MPRSMYAAVRVGAASVTFVKRAMPLAVSFCSSRCTALSKSARTSSPTVTDSEITKPLSVRTSRDEPVPSALQAEATSAAARPHAARTTRLCDVLRCLHIARSLRLLGLCRGRWCGRDRGVGGALALLGLGRRGGAGGCGSCGRTSPRRLVRVAVERAEEAAARLELRVALGLEHRELGDALLDPRVVVPRGQAREVLLVQQDGSLREGLGFARERGLVLLEVRGPQAARTLRFLQRAGELRVDLRHVEGGRGGHVGDFVVDQLAEGVESRVHAPLLLLQVLLEGLDQLHLVKAEVEVLGQHQRRLRCEIADARVAAAARRRVDLHDLVELLAVARLVATVLLEPCDLEARLDRRLERLGELTHVVE